MKHVLVATALLASAAIANAEPNDARAAFERGQAALKAGRIHEACEAFAASEKLAPTSETEISLAACYERDGKPASAARLYRGLAERDADGRRKTWTAKAAKLEALAPKLRFAINPMPAGIVVKVDGVQVSPTEDALVDTGPHEVIATAPGYEGRASAPVDREGAILDVIIRMEPRAEPAAPKAEPPPPAPAPPAAATAPRKEAPRKKAAMPGAEPEDEREDAMPLAERDDAPRTSSNRRRNGLIAGAVGLGVLVGAGVTFGLSASKLDEEHALCPDQQCPSDAALVTANSLISDARTLRGVSIGMGIGGALLVAAGTYLVLTGDSHVTVHADTSGAGLMYTARF